MIKEIGHDENLDIWCLGVLMFELITGNLPFTGKDVQNLSGNILKNKIIWPNDIGADEKDILTKILKTNPTDRLSLKGILAHPYFTKVKVHENFVFYTPKEVKDDSNEIFMISTGINNPTTTKSKTSSKVLSDKKPDSSVNLSQFEQSSLNTASSTNNTFDSDSLKKELSLNKQISEKYEKDLKELEKSNMSEKMKVDELKKLNQDLLTQLQVLALNKESLLTDLQEKETLKMKSLREIAELNEKIFDKDNKNKTLSRANKALEEKNKYNDEELKRLEKLVEENDNKLEQLKTENTEKVNELQKKLLEAYEKDENVFDTRCTLIRDSINEMATINPVNKYNFGMDNQESDIKNKIEKEYEEKINKIQTDFNNQILSLQKEITSERNKFNALLKDRETDIKKLLEEKKTIKDTVAKTYEKSLKTNDLTLKIKDSEIEKLNTQIKKLEKLMEMNGIKKK